VIKSLLCAAAVCAAAGWVRSNAKTRRAAAGSDRLFDVLLDRHADLVRWDVTGEQVRYVVTPMYVSTCRALDTHVAGRRG
jgi:hypothetical protein